MNSCGVSSEEGQPKTGVSGVILAQGGVHSGWSLYIKDGKPKLAYNYLGNVTTVASNEPCPRVV